MNECKNDFPVLKIFLNCIIYFDSNFKVAFTNGLNSHSYVVYPPNVITSGKLKHKYIFENIVTISNCGYKYRN